MKTTPEMHDYYKKRWESIPAINKLKQLWEHEAADMINWEIPARPDWDTRRVEQLTEAAREIARLKKSL